MPVSCRDVAAARGGRPGSRQHLVDVTRGQIQGEKRQGHGVQEGPDGSKYEGQFLNGLKHGTGKFTWENGEYYEGSFYKDYRHGEGVYCWPTGHKFIGKFYLNRKEGYGLQLFPGGTTFQGLYHADQKFGPGVVSYPDGCQDVGLWHREHLLKLCTSLEGGFSLNNLPEYAAYMGPAPTICSLAQVEIDPLLNPYRDLLSDDRFILPPDMEGYSTDGDHLPLPPGLRRELDQHFHGQLWKPSPDQYPDYDPAPLSTLPLEPRMQAHIHRHRLQAASLDWDVAAVLSLTRDTFGPKGLVNCHNDVIHLLLDMGADINKLNCEGMSALAVCNVLYYPIQSLHTTVAEKAVKSQSPQDNSPQTGPLDFARCTTTANNRPQTGSSALVEPQINQTHLSDQTTEELTEQVPGHDSNLSDGSDHGFFIHLHNSLLDGPETATSTGHLEEERGEEDRQEETMELGSVLWQEGGARAAGTVQHPATVGEFNINPIFDSTRSLDSFHILVTEEVMQRTAEVLSHTGVPQCTDTQETVRKMAAMKIEHRIRWNTLKLLLERGADPNASRVPMPVLFLAIKAAHTEAVRTLLQCGARTDLPLPPERKGLYPLHIAAGLPGPEGPRITELLLHTVIDPDAQAHDQDDIYELDKTSVEPQAALDNKTPALISWGPASENSFPPREALVEGGRTALHVACQRDNDYSHAREVVSLLLSHRASTHLLWSGHSPLSLAIASGNDLVVEELLKGGADPNLPLSRRVGSALCALANISYHSGGQPSNAAKLLDVLVKAGANILMPVMVGEGRRCVLGTAVDYAHHTFNQDLRVAQTPYHTLSMRERKVFNARRQLLSLMGDLLRQAAVRTERERLEREQCLEVRGGGKAAPDSPLSGLYHPLQSLPLSGSAAAVPHGDAAAEDTLHRTVVEAPQDGAPKSRFPQLPEEVETLVGLPDQTGGVGAPGEVLGYVYTQEVQDPVPQCGAQSQRVELLHQGTSGTERFLYMGLGGTPPKGLARAVVEEEASCESLSPYPGTYRKPLFKFCYQCGCSVGVVLTACSRCHQVFYCSNTCKMKAWSERHKDECIRVPGRVSASKQSARLKSPRTTGPLSMAGKVSKSHLNENYSFN
ncbi:ankyrin repeat and MYND domain-containing protein 1 [Polymixia lowei]